jgi:hypothetical protein
MDSYEEVPMIKTFRGLMADGAQDTIVLHTNTGSTGYRIVKFQMFPKYVGQTDYENVVKVYKVAQTSIDALVDFSDNTLLAAGYVEGYSGNADTDGFYTIFDQEIFNQDIYITHKDVSTGAAVNYYLELEQVKLDLNQNTVATLKDIRNVTAP